MSQRTLFFVIGGVVLALIVFVVWGMTAPSAVAPMEDADTADASTIYFYGEECPHCKDIAKFLEENNIAEKVSFVKKEVWRNPQNARAMDRKMDECDLPKEGRGVPFVWSEGKCFVGGPDVEGFFREKAGIP